MLQKPGRFHSRTEPAGPPGPVAMGLGIEHLDADSVGSWMLTNLDRTHFFLPGDRAPVRAALEIHVRARVGSVFEGVSIGTRRTAGPNE